MNIGCLKAATGLVMGLVIALTGVAAAEQLAKSGSGSIHSGYKGMGDTTPIGEQRMYWTGAHWGVSFNDAGKGFLHHVAWYCPALTDIHYNVMTTKGACTLTDRDGDKIYGDWTGKGTVGGEFAGALTMNGGTGKYAGVEGGWDFRCQGIGVDNQLYCQQTYTYKLP